MSKIVTSASANFITRQYLDSFLSGIALNDNPLTDEVARIANEPKLASHLCTPRGGYFHHGIYVGDDKVIHYSGLANGLETGPVEIIELRNFQKSNGHNKGFEVITHKNLKFSAEVIVSNAYNRLNEKEYNLVWNNCEHFVNECLYGYKKSKQVNNALKVVANKAITPIEIKNSFDRYLKGQITGKRFIEEVSDEVITFAAASWYGALGVSASASLGAGASASGIAAVAIPAAGFLIGASIGVFIGNALLASGHISLSESSAVKIAKERRLEVERMCTALKKQVQQSQQQLEEYFETYFSERRKTIQEALVSIEAVGRNSDLESFTTALNDLNQLFGTTLNINGFDEFDEIMMSDESLSF